MRHLIVFLLLGGCSTWIGCGGQQGVDGVVPVSGDVRYQGSPVEGAMVIFAPEGEGRASSGMTDANGRFALTTLRANDGVLPGKYRVTVAKTETAGEMTEEESQLYFAQHGNAPQVTTKELLPAKYKNADTSGLVAEIPSAGSSDLVFELTD